MKKILDDIKNNSYKSCYLLYGTEDYLKKFYKDKLKSGIVAEGDSMNFSSFSGRFEQAEVMNICETMPFFADRRLVLLEDTGMFKSANDFADYIPQIPETCVIVFVESDVDKRNRLYKAVKDNGYVCEINGMDEGSLRAWVATFMKRENKQISVDAINYFIETVGTDMMNMSNELTKLVDYVGEASEIRKEDIDAVCTPLITGKIFQMTDCIAGRNMKKAMEMYNDLITVREKPLTILYLIIRHFNILLLVKSMKADRQDKSYIASKAGIPPFAVAKYQAQADNYSAAMLEGIIRRGTELETDVKTGRLEEKSSVELLMVYIDNFSKRV